MKKFTISNRWNLEQIVTLYTYHLHIHQDKFILWSIQSKTCHGEREREKNNMMISILKFLKKKKKKIMTMLSFSLQFSWLCFAITISRHHHQMLERTHQRHLPLCIFVSDRDWKIPILIQLRQPICTLSISYKIKNHFGQYQYIQIYGVKEKQRYNDY